VTELEQRLVELGRQLDFPPEPSLVPAVRTRLTEPERRRRQPPVSGRLLAVALAVLAVAVGVAFAVPPARSAILRLFGIGGVRIERVNRLPEIRGRRPLRVGMQVSLVEARRRASFPVRVPTAAGFDEPDAVYFSSRVPGGLVSFVYGALESPRALLSELQTRRVFAEKVVGPGTTVDVLEIAGSPAYWVTGRPHGFVFVNVRGQLQEGTYRLATNALVWRRGTVTFRLEGAFTREDAVAIAESVR
jgi:hypothetical protein